jgi:hypothetical protein
MSSKAPGLPRQMVFGDRLVKMKLIEQLTLVTPQRAHHRSTPSRLASTQRNHRSRHVSTDVCNKIGTKRTTDFHRSTSAAGLGAGIVNSFTTVGAGGWINPWRPLAGGPPPGTQNCGIKYKKPLRRQRMSDDEARAMEAFARNKGADRGKDAVASSRDQPTHQIANGGSGCKTAHKRWNAGSFSRDCRGAGDSSGVACCSPQPLARSFLLN